MEEEKQTYSSEDCDQKCFSSRLKITNKNAVYNSYDESTDNLSKNEIHTR